ncbi:hypothetical protein [Baekduia sp. Peel2402]|uniref:hypothetical protein n=1 Tax=Baekduia sp. Peel2402 TaxID=3458296 RepID=UPI00403ED4E7
MRSSMRLAVLTVGLLSLFAVASTAASAVTWHNSGDTAFTATAGAPSFSSTGTSLSCTSATLSGTAPATTVGLLYTMSATGSYNGCSIAGTSMSVECSYKFTGTAQHGNTTTGSTDVTCGFYSFNSKLCHVAGARPSTYVSPSGSGIGVLTLSTSNLIISNGSSGTCLLGDNDVIEFAPQIYGVTSGTGGPRLTRTA